MTDLELAQEEALYWRNRCRAAEKVIKVSPGDPDILPEQVSAHAKWNRYKNHEPGDGEAPK